MQVVSTVDNFHQMLITLSLEKNLVRGFCMNEKCGSTSAGFLSGSALFEKMASIENFEKKKMCTVR